MKVRLKDLNNITSSKIDYSNIMFEIFGYRKTWLFKRLMFRHKFVKAYRLVSDVKEVDISKIELDRNIDLKVPSHIDNITYMAMMELQAILSKPYEDIQEHIANVITKVCFSENIDKDYSSSCGEYKDFKKLVLNSSLFEMMGIFNWIVKAVEVSNMDWKKRFLSVSVVDEDYEQANNGAMEQFNVIRTIKNLCKDFNVTYSEAWQLSYAVSQTSSYENATQNNVQQKLIKLKEAKMKKQRQAY